MLYYQEHVFPCGHVVMATGPHGTCDQVWPCGHHGPMCGHVAMVVTCAHRCHFVQRWLLVQGNSWQLVLDAPLLAAGGCWLDCTAGGEHAWHLGTRTSVAPDIVDYTCMYLGLLFLYMYVLVKVRHQAQ
jgi:hypothetical protein